MVVRSCPRCSTPVDVPAGQRPVCPGCGFGAQSRTAAPARPAASAAVAPRGVVRRKKKSAAPLVIGLLLGVLVLGGAAAGAAWFLTKDGEGEETLEGSADARRLGASDGPPLSEHPSYGLAGFSLLDEDEEEGTQRTVRVTVRQDGQTLGTWQATTNEEQRTALGEVRPDDGPTEVTVEETGRPVARHTFDIGDCEDRSIQIQIVVDGEADARVEHFCARLGFARASDP